MKKFILSAFMALSFCMTIAAGNLSKWTLYNFQGIWEITSTDSDKNLNWLVNKLYPEYIGDPQIDRATLALDYNGYGYIEFYSGTLSGKILVSGSIFTPHPEATSYECLSMLCHAGDLTSIRGINNIYIYASNVNPTDKDEFLISSMNMMNNAKAVKTSNIYDPSGINEVSATAMLIQYETEGISILEAETSKIAVYGVDGILQYQTNSYNGETIRLNKGNYYIVKVNDNSMKLGF